MRALHQAMSPLRSDGTPFFFFLMWMIRLGLMVIPDYAVVTALVLAATVNHLSDLAEKVENRYVTKIVETGIVLWLKNIWFFFLGKL
jgi:hypothetical protein